jgi:phage shock protein C
MRERLYRSRQDRMLFGVAGGMAEWLNLDPAIVRIVWALLFLAGGMGLVLYIVAAIVMPEAPVASGVGGGGTSSRGMDAQPMAGSGPGNGGVIFGLVLVAAGVWFLVDRYVENLDTGWVVPVALVVIGIALVFGALRRSRGSST